MDYSFLRFEANFTQAKYIKNSPVSSIIRNDVIQLLPNEFYLQITNLSSGITFDGDFEAYLIDCNGVELANITSKVAIYEFIDRNGINQIAIELYKIGLDFYKQQVFLKLVHTTGSDVYYSNGFLLTDYQSNKTTRFDYYNHTWLEGISYDKVNFYQSIRLQTWFDILEDKTEVSDYYQISRGNTISNRPLRKQSEKYVSEFMNNFTYERANLLLCHDVIYIDGVRMTNKTTFKGNDRVGDTNTFKTDFSCYKNYNDNYLAYPLIYEPLALISKSPLGIYTLYSLPTDITLSFNRDISVLFGTILIKDSSNVVVATFNQTDVSITDNIATIDITGTITTNDIYTIVVSEGLFTDSSDNSALYTWSFEVLVSGYYDENYYDENYYLT